MAKSNRTLALVVVALVLVGGLAAAIGLMRLGSTSPNIVLPSGCARPAGGFLIVAAYNGFNDSVGHGVPASPWPVVSVQHGSNVTIVV